MNLTRMSSILPLLLRKEEDSGVWDYVWKDFKNKHS